MLQIFKFFILLFLLIVALKFIIFVVYHWQIKVLGNLGEENKIYPQSPRILDHNLQEKEFIIAINFKMYLSQKDTGLLGGNL